MARASGTAFELLRAVATRLHFAASRGKNAGGSVPRPPTPAWGGRTSREHERPRRTQAIEQEIGSTESRRSRPRACLKPGSKESRRLRIP